MLRPAHAHPRATAQQPAKEVRIGKLEGSSFPLQRGKGARGFLLYFGAA